MADWNDLAHELDLWGEAARTATFWWRDDDAGPDDGLLEGFLAQRKALDVPLALATVPEWLTDRSAAAMTDDPGCSVLQHGVAHADRTNGERRKMELCGEALESGLAAEIAGGRERLAAMTGARFQPVMVPPWNRIDPAVTACLPGTGLHGLSTLGPRARLTESGLTYANVHIDIIDWKGDRRFAGEDHALTAARDHLRTRRLDEADAGEPTGLMTHHRVHDRDSCSFVDRFVAFVRDHPGARWFDASDVFFESRATP